LKFLRAEVKDNKRLFFFKKKGEKSMVACHIAFMVELGLFILALEDKEKRELITESRIIRI